MKNLFSVILLTLFTNMADCQSIKKQSDWIQRVDYKIDVIFSPENTSIKGTISMNYYNNSPDTLTEIYIHTWPNAYKNNHTAYAKEQLNKNNRKFYFSSQKDRGYMDSFAFKINGRTIEYQTDEKQIDILKIKLLDPILPGEKVEIYTPFFVKIPQIYSRMGRENSFFSITQWYPKPAVYDINGWNPMPYLNQGEFYSEFGNFEVSINTPKNYLIAATGNLQNIDELNFLKSMKGKKATRDDKERHTLTFKENNIHDFAWFADTSFFVDNSVAVLQNNDTIITWLFADKDYDKLIAKNPNYTHPILALNKGVKDYSRAIGNYPYKQCTVVIGALTAGAGMEYPTITICDSDEESTIIHEVGHNWFYGILGSNEREYPWMDESINTYFQEIFTNNYKTDKTFLSQPKWFGKHQNMFSVYNQAAKGESQKLNLPSESFTNENYGIIVYGKGPLLFAYLNDYLGEDIFLKCVKEYYETWKYKHPLPQDMKQSFEKSCGQNLTWFFDDLFNENFDTDIRYKKNESIAKSLPAFDSFYNKAKEKPNNFNGFLLEKNFNNNLKSKKLVNFGIPFKMPTNESKLNINLSPIVGYNLYDKLYLGAILYNRTIFRKKLEYYLMPAYSFDKNKVVGFGQINYLLSRNSKHFKFIQFSLIGQKFGQNIEGIYDNYIKLNPFIRFNFAHKNNDRYESSLKLSYNKTSLTDKTTQQPNNLIRQSFFYDYYNINHNYLIKNSVLPISVSTFYEFGKSNGYFNSDLTYNKTGVKIEGKLFLSSKNQYIKQKVFLGYFKNINGNNINKVFFISNNNQAQDYQYENAMIGRSEQYGDNNLFANQITDNLTTMRGIRANNLGVNKGIITTSTEIKPLNKIPISLFYDFAYFNTFSGNQFVNSAGLNILIVENNFEIFVPFYISDNIFIPKNNLLKSIGFKLNLNAFSPVKLINL